jgi:hypothetical protein
MDVKTVLLLGIGMAVLLLLGFCVAPSRSAALRTGLQVPSVPGSMLRETRARLGRERQSSTQSLEISHRVYASAEQPVMLVGLEG